jgi:hypothetical protein
MKVTTTIETMVCGEWITKIAPEQTKPHLTYGTRTAAEQALRFCPPGKRYRLSSLGLPVTVH